MTTRREVFKLAALPILAFAAPAMAEPHTSIERLSKLCKSIFGDKFKHIYDHSKFRSGGFPEGYYSIEIRTGNGGRMAWAVGKDIVENMSDEDLYRNISLRRPLYHTSFENMGPSVLWVRVRPNKIS